MRALWGHEAGPPLLAPVGGGDAVPRLGAAGRGLAVGWRAEQAVSGSATPALTMAPRRLSGQLLSHLWEPLGLPPSLPTLH